MATTYRVIRASADDDMITAVMTYDVPDNAVGQEGNVNWRTVVAEIRAATPEVSTSLDPGVTDFTDLDSGAKIEWLETFQDDGKLTPAARKSNLETYLGQRLTARIAEFENEYKYYGVSGSVVAT